MRDFFKDVYDMGIELHVFYHDQDSRYRRNHAALTQKLHELHLIEEQREDLMHAVYELSYAAELVSFSYGFRLAAQIITPVWPIAPTRD